MDQIKEELNALFDKAIQLDIPPLQEREEIIWAMTIAKDHLGKPKRILEIGSCYGGNLFLLSYLLNEEDLLIAIEPDLTTFDSVILSRNVDCKLEHIADYSYNAIEAIRQYGEFDLIFYDAGDNYEEIKRDFDLYSPLVRNGGLFMFHDIAKVGDTPKIWNELRHDRPYDAKVVSKSDEFIKTVNGSGRNARHTGIGILHMESKTDSFSQVDEDDTIDDTTPISIESVQLSVIVHISGNDKARSRNMYNIMELLRAQTYSQYELIIIEQSTDNQLYWQEATATVFPERIYKAIFHPEWCGGWCRNVGGEIASGEVLLFLDADTIFGNDYFEQIMTCFALDMQYMLPYSLGIRLKEEAVQSYLNKKSYTNLNRPEMIYATFAPSPKKACGAAMVLSKEAFNNIGGWNETLPFREDKDMARRLMVEYDTQALNQMDYMIGDLPHSRDKVQTQYIDKIYKYVIWDHAGMVTEILRHEDTGRDQRTIIDWLYYLYTKEIRYMDNGAITFDQWMPAKNIVEMIPMILGE